MDSDPFKKNNDELKVFERLFIAEDFLVVMVSSDQNVE